MNWGDKYRDEDVYYEICPIVKNIGNADMPYSFLEVETFIDGVSSGKGNCNTSLPKQKELTFWNLCQTGAILPRGIHTVKFQINTQDVFNGNNSLNKTMFRP